jgi:hypothetical protein
MDTAQSNFGRIEIIFQNQLLSAHETECLQAMKRQHLSHSFSAMISIVYGSPLAVWPNNWAATSADLANDAPNICELALSTTHPPPFSHQWAGQVKLFCANCNAVKVKYF